MKMVNENCRCRHGYFHVVNNDYTHWEMYAIGGSANPTINSQGNRYLAPTNTFAKEVHFNQNRHFGGCLDHTIFFGFLSFDKFHHKPINQTKF